MSEEEREMTENMPFPSSERMELLGDAALDVCVSTFLLSTFPRIVNAGSLTLMRQRLVNNDMMSDVMCDNQFDELLLHSSPSLRESIRQYSVQRRTARALSSDTTPSHPSHALSSSFSSSFLSPLSAPKQLADAFESLLAAVYIDSGYQLHTVWDAFIAQVNMEVEVKRGSVRVRGGRYQKK